MGKGAVLMEYNGNQVNDLSHQSIKWENLYPYWSHRFEFGDIFTHTTYSSGRIWFFRNVLCQSNFTGLTRLGTQVMWDDVAARNFLISEPAYLY
jgi:hypothetical protein